MNFDNTMVDAGTIATGWLCIVNYCKYFVGEADFFVSETLHARIECKVRNRANPYSTANLLLSWSRHLTSLCLHIPPL